jgi:hypothetical protein
MFREIDKSRERQIQDSGFIELNMPTYPETYGYPETTIFEYCLLDGKSDMGLFRALTTVNSGVLILDDVVRLQESLELPKSVMFTLCEMIADSIIDWTIENGYDIVMLITEYPLFPEVLVSRKFDISRNVMGRGWRFTLDVDEVVKERNDRGRCTFMT